MNVHVNTFSPDSDGVWTGASATYQPSLKAVTEAARPARRERHASCYLWNRRRCINDGIPCKRSGRSVRGGYGMAVEWDRDYHFLRGGISENRGPGIPRRSPGGTHSSRRIIEAIYPVSLSVHLSARPFGPDWCSNLRPYCGMTAEFTENLTLSRAHARGDSPWSLERRSPAAPWGPAIWLLRMRLAALRCDRYRMGHAIGGAFRRHCLMY